LASGSGFRGVGTAFDVLGPDELLTGLVEAGYRLSDFDEQSTVRQC
jgi:hypothetical protein